MITDSQFNMWRTVFALAHADGIVTEDEKKFMRDILEDVDFSLEQREVLQNDVDVPQDIVAMYQKITAPEDRTAFFKFGKTMVWVDGDFGMDEQAVMTQLQRLKIAQTDVDGMVGRVDLELEGDGDGEEAVPQPRRSRSPMQVRDMLFSFKDSFNKK